jgi:hypothetical protein
MTAIKDPTLRIWKWKLKLSDFEFDIQYKKERANANADALSRNLSEICLPIRKREEDSPDPYPHLKRFQLNTSTEDSPIFEANPRGLPQYSISGK